MFKDLALSKDLLVEFHERHSDDRPLSVMVLQYSCWPYQPKRDREIDLPPDVLQFKTLEISFSDVYLGRCSVLWSDILTFTKLSINHANSTGSIPLALLH